MQGISESEVGPRVVMATTAAAGLLVLVGVASSGGHAWNTLPTDTASTPLADGLLSGAFVAGAVAAALVTWRRHGGRLAGWVVGTGALVAAQSLAVTLLALQLPPPRTHTTFALLVGAAVVGLVCVVVPLLGLDRVGHVVDDSFIIGLGMGLTAAGYLVLQFPMSQPPRPPMLALAGVLVTTHVVTAALVLRQRTLPAQARALLVVTVSVVSFGLAVRWGLVSGGGWELASVLSRAAVGAAWFGTAWSCLQRNAEEDERRTEEINHVVSTTRDQRERMHELRSTMAGLVSGSALLDNDDIPAETRDRLWRSVRREMDRMERLLAGQEQPATVIDLDEALTGILDLQRLKGRTVELHSEGGSVHGRYDALAEVVNILVDNAVTHGGTDTSVVEVVQHDDTVDIRVTDFGSGIEEDQRERIFEWGGRASDAPGEGIGLHVAQRLVAEDGGSLELAEAAGPGSSFVISLPAARRSPENGVTVGGGSHGWDVAR
ncbi:sensor histidine kinase [Nocardioides zeicaulis]